MNEIPTVLETLCSVDAVGDLKFSFESINTPGYVTLSLHDKEMLLRDKKICDELKPNFEDIVK